ncbi:MAG: hypothetical protein V1753_07280 [Pseudomonadota bacterium]
MEPCSSALSKISLEFLVDMGGCLTHDIRNSLATINEQAGLIDDLGFISDKNSSVDIDRMKALSGKIIKRVERIHALTDAIDRLAEGVMDKNDRLVLNHLLGVFVQLFSAFALSRGVALELTRAESIIRIKCNYFYLINFLWKCIKFATLVADSRKRITIVIDETGEEARIVFANLDLNGDFQLLNNIGFPGKSENALIAELGANLTVRPDLGEIIIVLYK